MRWDSWRRDFKGGTKEIHASNREAMEKLVAIAGAAALAEAVSPHGWDNATLQLVPPALVWFYMT